MSHDEVPACPECDSTPVVPAASGGRSNGEPSDYRCVGCGTKFDEPRWRERRSDPDIRGDSLAAKLEDAEPGDLRTDGGTDPESGGQGNLSLHSSSGSARQESAYEQRPSQHDHTNKRPNQNVEFTGGTDGDGFMMVQIEISHNGD